MGELVNGGMGEWGNLLMWELGNGGISECGN